MVPGSAADEGAQDQPAGVAGDSAPVVPEDAAREGVQDVPPGTAGDSVPVAPVAPVAPVVPESAARGDARDVPGGAGRDNAPGTHQAAPHDNAADSPNGAGRDTSEGGGRDGEGDTADRPSGAQHGVQAGEGGAFTESVPALILGALLIAGALGAAAHRLFRERLFAGR
ncbi:hypothetical protein [Streptomyces fagopyri]|uniref:hypothetical protein n=1 Tax=Streptomyces fagopyri TaxID=2662397 RepID=UPI001293CEDB|nr:hypothetical protein [Streptomyces fagopyri]